MLRRLWSTDFDGTLYCGLRRDAVISQSVIASISEWILEGGWFHVLSGGSMKGMVRDDFDLVAMVRDHMESKGVPDPAALLVERMSFSMSNGIEHYRVANPNLPMARGQLHFDEAHSYWVTPDEARDFQQQTVERFGLEVLATDTPLGPHEQKAVALFLRRLQGREGSGLLEASQMNEELADMGSNLHLVFVRETQQQGDLVQRFDAFPRTTSDLTKRYAAERIFPKFDSVIYTGDQPCGNDRALFCMAETVSHVRCVQVTDPDCLAEVVFE